MTLCKSIRALLRVSLFMAAGFVLAVPAIGLSIGGEQASLEQQVDALEHIKDGLDRRHADLRLRDLRDLGEDAAIRHARLARGGEPRFGHRIAPAASGIEIEGRILSSETTSLRYHGQYTVFRLQTDEGVEALITAQPEIAEILTQMPRDQMIWLRGDARLRLYHGHAMARRTTRVLEITHFAALTDPADRFPRPMIVALQMPSEAR